MTQPRPRLAGLFLRTLHATFRWRLGGRSSGEIASRACSIAAMSVATLQGDGNRGSRSSWLRLCARQCRPRYSCVAGLGSGTRIFSTLQGFLARKQKQDFAHAVPPKGRVSKGECRSRLRRNFGAAHTVRYTEMAPDRRQQRFEAYTTHRWCFAMSIRGTLSRNASNTGIRSSISEWRSVR